MNRAGQIGKRVFFIVYLLAIHTLAGIFIFERLIAPSIRTDDSFAVNVRSPTEETPAPTPLDVPDIIPESNDSADPSGNSENGAKTPSDQNSNQNFNRHDAPPAEGRLMIPVVGVKREQLLDTFADSRSNERRHDAIDIMAPLGTPVVAAADGEIARFFDSEAGGITIYQFSADRKFVYYYAHLQKRAENLKETDFVRQGTIIGFVGDTGNSGAGNYHLHFSISLVNDPKRYWEGSSVNPYPLLKDSLEAR